MPANIAKYVVFNILLGEVAACLHNQVVIAPVKTE